MSPSSIAWLERQGPRFAEYALHILRQRGDLVALLIRVEEADKAIRNQARTIEQLRKANKLLKGGKNAA